MALSEEQKQNIIEEETLRAETRRNISQGGCCKGGEHGHGRCCGKWGWIVAAILAVLLIMSHCCHHRGCGPMGMRGCMMGGPGMAMEQGGGMPPHCKMMGGMGAEQAPAAAEAPKAKK